LIVIGIDFLHLSVVVGVCGTAAALFKKTCKVIYFSELLVHSPISIEPGSINDKKTSIIR
jgi:hypothetical protein